MPILTNPKHEAFAQAIGLGTSSSHVDAAKIAGYKGTAIRSAATKLYAMPHIKARIEELGNKRTQQVVAVATISKQWVLEELADTYRAAKEKGDLNQRRLVLGDIGTELGMFVKKTEAKFEWTGDPSELTDAQLKKLQHLLERLAFGNDEQALIEARREGNVLDIEAVDVVPQEKEPDGW